MAGARGEPVSRTVQPRKQRFFCVFGPPGNCITLKVQPTPIGGTSCVHENCSPLLYVEFSQPQAAQRSPTVAAMDMAGISTATNTTTGIGGIRAEIMATTMTTVAATASPAMIATKCAAGMPQTTGTFLRAWPKEIACPRVWSGNWWFAASSRPAWKLASWSFPSISTANCLPRRQIVNAY